MGKLVALGVDPSPLMYGPAWMGPVWAGIVDQAEARRLEWSRVDAASTINALAEAVG